MDSTGHFPKQHIYVATSWRNEMQPQVVQALSDAGYEVYDFRKPNGEKGFAWSDLGHDMLGWDPNLSSPHNYIDVLGHPIAVSGYQRDMNALTAADIVVLLLPCERDAHLELGWAVGAGKETHLVLDDPCKASLMYSMVDHLHRNLDDLLVTLGTADS